MDELSDKLVAHVFSFLPQYELCKAVPLVCRRWKTVSSDGRLWQRVSARPEYASFRLSCVEALLSLLSIRCGTSLRYLELPCEYITVPVLHEIAAKCTKLQNLTLDFSRAMQLYDFNELNAFPCNLKGLCLCLSEVIFMEGFMRRIYSCLSTLQTLHLIGTFELSDEEEEEIYEVINISKIKAHTPNLRVVNLYGISFVDDSHLELLASNCIHLETVAASYCLRVKGTCLPQLVQKCRKLKTLLLIHTSLTDENMRAVKWEQSSLEEIDLTSTELSADCLTDIFVRMPPLTFLGVGHCDFFGDETVAAMQDAGRFQSLLYLNAGYTTSWKVKSVKTFLTDHGLQLQGLMLNGKQALGEQFWLFALPKLANIRILVFGTAHGWFLDGQSVVHVDQLVNLISHLLLKLERLEVQWDSSTIRFSDKSSKFVDQLRVRCTYLKSLTLSDGGYYEMVKSNFERSERGRVVRTCTSYHTSITCLLRQFNDLLFN